MSKLLSAEQMRGIEAAAIDSGRVTGLELMERAGTGVVAAIAAAWPERARAPGRAVVICGPGNNGGDGFVVARLLKAQGWHVQVHLFGHPDKLPPDARANCDRWMEADVIHPFEEAPRRAEAADLFVDALFGTGLARPLEGDLLDWVRACREDPEMAARTVAVDMPSGLCSDSGRMLAPESETVVAGLTVSFHAEKLGHRLALGPARCGRVVVADIGLDHTEDAVQVQLAGRPAPDVLAKCPRDHKYDHGHALVLTGGAGATGAARLAARAALRIGAGLVTLGVPPAAQLEVAAQVTAIMLRRVADADGLTEVLEDPRFNALCLGPGLGPERARALVPVVLGAARPGLCAGASTGEVPGQARDGKRGAVLDADALTAFAEDPDALFALTHGTQAVLTPHAGEFGRLFPDIAERLSAAPEGGPAYSKVDAARAAADRAGCVVLFKGPDTVVAAPGGRCAVNSAHYDRSAPWLATAGAGDVLSGLIAGLMARGLTPMTAATTGSWLHVEAALHGGAGLIAEDLPEILPRVLSGLEAGP